MNAVLALAMYLASGDARSSFFVILMLSVLWNLAATLCALVVGGRAQAKGFLLATGLVSLASFALCATLGFAL